MSTLEERLSERQAELDAHYAQSGHDGLTSTCSMCRLLRDKVGGIRSRVELLQDRANGQARIGPKVVNARSVRG